MEHVESFLQIKSLFLLLQVLYDLKQSEPAKPILFLLEVKLPDFMAIINQKKLIQDRSSTEVPTSSPATETDEEKKQ